MSEAVVDRLEVVEVEEQHAEAFVRIAPRALDSDAYTLDEECAIRQTGQAIVQSVVTQLLLDPLGVSGAALQLDLRERRDSDLAKQTRLFRGPVPRLDVDRAKDRCCLAVGRDETHAEEAGDAEISRCRRNTG